jgi:hypothetical protein
VVPYALMGGVLWCRMHQWEEHQKDQKKKWIDIVYSFWLHFAEIRIDTFLLFVPL